MDVKTLGKTGLSVTPLAFGAFKIGRNEGIKYPTGYDLPTEDDAAALLHAVLDMGIRYIDTAPAYGLSEARIGGALHNRRDEYTLSTKVGETFEAGQSTYDFSRKGINASVQRSLERLRTDVIDLLLIHSDGNDAHILNQTDAVETLHDLRARGVAKAIGFSGKTTEGLTQAMTWADAIMVEFNAQQTQHVDLIANAREQNIGVIIKKGLASGHLPPDEAIRFVLNTPGVDTLVVGGLNPDHLQTNLRIAESCNPSKD